MVTLILCRFVCVKGGQQILKRYNNEKKKKNKFIMLLKNIKTGIVIGKIQEKVQRVKTSSLDIDENGLDQAQKVPAATVNAEEDHYMPTCVQETMVSLKQEDRNKNSSSSKNTYLVRSNGRKEDIKK